MPRSHDRALARARLARPGELSRRAVLAGGLGLLAAGAVAGCAQQPYRPTTTASDPAVTIGLTYIPNIQFAPFYVAEANGLFSGVQATLRHHGAKEGLFTALVAGQEDFVIAGGDEVVQARAQGMDVVAIGQYYHAYPVVAIVPEASPVQTAADLAGRSIGLPGRSGETYFGLKALLHGAGLTESDVLVQEIGYTQQAALTTGQVEAIIGFANNDAVQFEQAGIPTRTIPLTASGQVPLVSIVLATTRAFLDANPDAATAVAVGMVKGVQATVDAPASAVESSRAQIPSLSEAGAEAAASATLDATIPLWAPDGTTVTGRMDPQAWQDMTTFMMDAGLVDSAVDPALAMTNAHLSE